MEKLANRTYTLGVLNALNDCGLAGRGIAKVAELVDNGDTYAEAWKKVAGVEAPAEVLDVVRAGNRDKTAKPAGTRA